MRAIGPWSQPLINTPKYNTFPGKSRFLFETPKVSYLSCQFFVITKCLDGFCLLENPLYMCQTWSSGLKYKIKKASGCQLILKGSPSLEFQLTLWLLFPQLFAVFNNRNFVIYRVCFSCTRGILDHHDLFFPDQKPKSFVCMLPIKRMLSWLHFR